MKPTKSFDLFAAGNALMEATFEVSSGECELIGVPKGGMQLIGPEVAENVATKWNERMRSLVPAGAECNVATGVASLGGDALFLGRIGSDAWGVRYEQQLQSLGVTTRLTKGAGTTGIILSFVTPDSERSMLTHLGEAVNFSRNDLDVQLVTTCRHAFISAFFFQPPSTRTAALAVADAALASNTPIAFDVSDAMLILENGDLIKHVVEKYAAIVFANEMELEALGSICGDEPERYLMKHSSIAVLKKGSKGAKIISKNGVLDIPAVEARVVDTTGAGDAFAAGFLLALLRGYSLAVAGKAGCMTASKVVAQYGSCFPGKLTGIL